MKEILLYGAIYSWTVRDLINEMIGAGNSPVTLRINTDGGSVVDCWGVIAKFRELTGAKKIKVDGRAHSMGMFFCCYADDVTALDVSQFLVHRAGYSEYFEGSDMFTDALKANLDKINADLRAAFEAKVDVEKFEKISGVTVDDIFSMEGRKEVFLTAKQAKSIGLISRIEKITPEVKAKIDAYALDVAAHFQVEAKEDKNENPKSQNMTFEDFIRKHPEAAAAMKAQILKEERDRVGAYLVFIDADPAAVKAGIESGDAMSQTAMAELTVKAAANGALASLQKETTETPKGEEAKPEAKNANEIEISTEEPNAEAEDSQKVKDFEAEVMANLNLGKEND
jgi:ATP-dependent protease ClpP protease subunit